MRITPDLAADSSPGGTSLPSGKMTMVFPSASAWHADRKTSPGRSAILPDRDMTIQFQERPHPGKLKQAGLKQETGLTLNHQRDMQYIAGKGVIYGDDFGSVWEWKTPVDPLLWQTSLHRFSKSFVKFHWA